MEKITSIFSERLLKVNELILKKMDSSIPLISEIAEYILASGGKRLRPLLALSSARLLNYNGPDKDVCLAAAVELIHTATLLHDDVVDKSNKRRNKKTANEVWGNEPSILVGDFLFSRAFELMVDTNSLEVLKTLSKASCKISEGEMKQLIFQNNINISKTDYIKIIKGNVLLIGSNITPPSYINNDTVKNPSRTRKLLLNQKEINTLIGKVQKEGLTLIPLSLYWKSNKVKLKLGVAKGKKKFDKRQSEKNKDWSIEKNRVLKNKLKNN